MFSFCQTIIYLPLPYRFSVLFSRNTNMVFRNLKIICTLKNTCIGTIVKNSYSIFNAKYINNGQKNWFVWSNTDEKVFTVTERFRRSISCTKTNVKFAPNRLLPFEVETNVSRDVMLFKNEKSRFFKLLSFFGMIQLAFCMYLGHFSFKNLRDISQSDVETQIGKQKNELHGLSFWKKINLGENKYRYGITLLCCSVGYLIAVCTGLYTLRSVRYLILLRGGEVARLVTYTPFGGNRIIDVSLRDLSCQQARDQATSFLSLKVRNRWMFFLVDKRGTFLNPKLFDSTVGLYRTLK